MDKQGIVYYTWLDFQGRERILQAAYEWVDVLAIGTNDPTLL